MTKLKRNATILPALVAALLLLGCDGCGRDRVPDGLGPGADLAEPEDDKPGDPVQLFLLGLRAFNEANLKDLLRAYSDNATWYMPSSNMPLVRGRRSVARQIVAFKGLMPESTIGVRRLLEGDGWLVAQSVLHAMQRWDSQGIERPPKKVGYELVFFVRHDDMGQAAETLVYYDQATLRRQLGAIGGHVPAVPPWPDQPQRVEASGNEQNVERAKTVVGMVEQGRLDGLDELAAPGFVVRDLGSGLSYSLAEIKERLLKERESILTPRFEIKQTVAAGDFVAVRLTEKATLAAGADAGPESGSPVEFHVAWVFEFAGDKIKVLETYANEMELRLQIKLIAAQKQAAGAAQPDAGSP